MLKLGIILLVVALLLSFLGAGALGALAWQIGIVLAVIGLVLAAIHVIGGART